MSVTRRRRWVRTAARLKAEVEAESRLQQTPAGVCVLAFNRQQELRARSVAQLSAWHAQLLAFYAARDAPLLTHLDHMSARLRHGARALHEAKQLLEALADAENEKTKVLAKTAFFGTPLEKLGFSRSAAFLASPTVASAAVGAGAGAGGVAGAGAGAGDALGEHSVVGLGSVDCLPEGTAGTCDAIRDYSLARSLVTCRVALPHIC